MKKEFDYLIVGSGLFGATFAHQMIAAGKKCLVVDKRPHNGGNLYCETIEGIPCHKYGPHIFHTNDFKIWSFVCSKTKFNNFIYSPVANYNGILYSLPFNMNTFYQMWGTSLPYQAQERISSQKAGFGAFKPDNLEMAALQAVGTDIYTKLIRGYTMKQWGRDPKLLPASIIKRIPLRFTYDNNYFSDKYQGIPENGYNGLIERLLEGCTVMNCIDYNPQTHPQLTDRAEKVVYTGPLDKYFNYSHGKLEYRSLSFNSMTLPMENYQGTAVTNFTSIDVPYTRLIEHRHFYPSQKFGPFTVITKEYPCEYVDGENEPYYPINDSKNAQIALHYKALAQQTENVIFGGRLATYQYLNMDQVIAQALHKAEVELKRGLHD